MTSDQLRNSILQEAISGRLVPQDPNDEPASMLLEKFEARRAELIAEKKVKPKDNVPLPIKEDDIPYELPAGWCWCRIAQYTQKVTDFVASGSFASLRENVKYYDTPNYAVLVRTKDFRANFSKDLVYTDKHGYEFLENSRLFGGEMILPNIGASIGKVFIVPTLPFRMTLAPNSVMTRFFFDYQREWLYYFFLSPFGQETLSSISSATAQGKFNKTEFKQILFPLPPLAEQKRIVAKLEELLPIVEQYGKAQSELDQLNAALPARLRQSILQEAISGRLVPQDPNDEPAAVLLARIREEKARLVKEGKLKKKDLVETPITEEEIPFEIPASWEWVRYQDIADCALGKTKNPNQVEGELCQYLCSINVYWDSVRLNVLKEMLFSDTDKQKYSVEKGDMLICEGGEAGRSAIYEGNISPIYYQNALHRVRFYGGTYTRFFLYQMELYKKTGLLTDHIKGETIQHFVSTKLLNLPIPLPPLAEQQRIVTKIEELFEQIDKLSK